MRKLILYVLLFCAVFAALSGAAIVIGRRQPPPARLAVLHLTECAPPCWIGIVPDKTTLDDAKKVIESTLNLSLVSEDSGEFPYLKYALFLKPQSQIVQIILAGTKDRVIRTITFNLYETFPFVLEDVPTLAELQGVFGAPRRIIAQDIIIYGGPSLDYGTDNQGVMLHVLLSFTGRDRLTWDLQPTRIVLYGADHMAWKPENPPIEIFRWRGFYRYYIPPRY